MPFLALAEPLLGPAKSLKAHLLSAGLRFGTPLFLLLVRGCYPAAKKDVRSARRPDPHSLDSGRACPCRSNRRHPGGISQGRAARQCGADERRPKRVKDLPEPAW